MMIKYLDSKKVNRALEDKKLILCDIWLDYCYYFFTFVNLDDFVINKERDRLAREIYSLNFNYILEKNKETISKHYSLENDNVDLFLQRMKKD